MLPIGWSSISKLGREKLLENIESTEKALSAGVVRLATAGEHRPHWRCCEERKSNEKLVEA
jgi:hypothetical protein